MESQSDVELDLRIGELGAAIHKRMQGEVPSIFNRRFWRGPGYLRHFADPRAVTENTMRRGFTPDVAQ